MKSKLYWASIVLALSTSAARACAEEPPGNDGVIVSWRSNNQTRTDLARSLERLYVVLYNTGNLPVRTIAVQAANDMTVQAVLRREGIVQGAHFPLAVDALVCDLNPSLCSRARVKARGKDLEDKAANINGTLPSPGHWKHHEGSRLVVPAVLFSDYIETVTARNPVKTGVSIDTLIAGVRDNCKDREDECERMLRRLNPAVFYSNPRDLIPQPDTIQMPALAIETQLALFGVKAQESRTNIAGLREVKMDEWLVRHPVADRLVNSSKRSATDSLNALSDNIVGYGPAKELGAANGTPLSSPELAKLLSHPVDAYSSWPGDLKQPVRVSIFDGRFDASHCGFDGAVHIDNSLRASGISTVDRPPAGTCGEELVGSTPRPSTDHGTHVAGLIGARPKNQSHVLGLNPFSYLTLVSVDMDQMSAGEYQARVGDHIRAMGISDTPERVMNLSWGYTTLIGHDAIFKRIQNIQETTLVVVAADAVNASREEICDGPPACFDNKLNNVITVVGLDAEANPSVWKFDAAVGSDWATQFGIGAVASDVVSTVYGGYSARMSGTSQAAPQVAAAASLIYSRYQTHYEPAGYLLRPGRVKNRLIYTADIFTSLLNKVKGGRLNVRRAVSLKRAQLSYLKGEERLYAVGEFSASSSDFKSLYIECRIAAGGDDPDKKVQIPFSKLRRMYFNEDNATYVVFYDSEKGSNDPVQRLPACGLTTATNVAVFSSETPGGGTNDISLQFSQIRDYTSPIF